MFRVVDFLSFLLFTLYTSNLYLCIRTWEHTLLVVAVVVVVVAVAAAVAVVIVIVVFTLLHNW